MSSDKDYSEVEHLVGNKYVNTDSDIRVTITDVYYESVQGFWTSVIEKEGGSEEEHHKLEDIVEGDNYVLVSS